MATKPRTTVPFEEIEAELLADPETRAAYNALEPAYQYDAFLQEELRDPQLAAAYLSAALAGGSNEGFLLALRSVLRVHGLDLDFTPVNSTT
jgi:hypothetical protein